MKWTSYPLNATPPVGTTGKVDYCVNVGSQGPFADPGPGTYTDGDNLNYWKQHKPSVPNNGICYQHSTVELRQITDGTSNTYMVCERNVNPDNYKNGLGADDDGVFVGFDNDSCRWAFAVPLQDTPGVDRRDCFGSAHAAGWQAVMCDGSVHALGYSIDLQTHQRLGNRADGLPVEIGEL
ncbi:MAG: DUF1559 domain-containing protein [Pirellulales bacterium]